MNIWVPKFKIVEPKREISVPMGFKGRFVMEAVKPDGHRRKLAEFDNLILDQGLGYLGSTSSWLAACQVGSGSTAAATNQTSLQSYVAGTTTIQSSTVTAYAGPPAYSENVRTYRFAQGAAAGNLTEVGIGTASASGSNLFSRARIVDGSNNPTTITVLSDEFLDVTYIFRSYPLQSDLTGTINISGTTYDYLIRGLAINSTAYNEAPGIVFGSIGGDNAVPWATAFASGTVPAATASYNSSGGYSVGTTSLQSYVSGSYQRDRLFTWNLNDGNTGSGIGRVAVRAIFAGFQIGFTPNVPKDNTKIFTLTGRISWARRP